MNLIRSFYY